MKNYPKKYKKAQNGFTLVELAIVIVIIGLITGGVLGAQSLMKSAERRAVIREITDMKTALKAFQLEYDALPGDMEDAYDYFGDDCGADSTDNRSGCNGGGDKCIGGWNDFCPPAGDAITAGDKRRLFVHLALSEILILPYIDNLSADVAANGCVLGLTLPESANGKTYYVDSHTTTKVTMTYASNYYDDNGGSVCRVLGEKFFHPTEMKWYDEKLDDGNARRGFVTAGTDNDCSNSEGVYSLSSSRTDCSLIVEMD